MKLMLFGLIETGFFQCLLSFEANPWIFTIDWIALLIGAVMVLILHALIHRRRGGTV